MHFRAFAETRNVGEIASRRAAHRHLCVARALRVVESDRDVRGTLFDEIGRTLRDGYHDVGPLIRADDLKRGCDVWLCRRCRRIEHSQVALCNPNGLQRIELDVRIRALRSNNLYYGLWNQEPPLNSSGERVTCDHAISVTRIRSRSDQCRVTRR